MHCCEAAKLTGALYCCGDGLYFGHRILSAEVLGLGFWRCLYIRMLPEACNMIQLGMGFDPCLTFSRVRSQLLPVCTRPSVRVMEEHDRLVTLSRQSAHDVVGLSTSTGDQ